MKECCEMMHDIAYYKGRSEFGMQLNAHIRLSIKEGYKPRFIIGNILSLTERDKG